MLSKNNVRFVVSLHTKKVRDELGLYLAEGDKIVREFINAGITLKSLYATSGFIDNLPAGYSERISDIIIVNNDDLARISSLKTPNNALAVVQMPDIKKDNVISKDRLTIALDCIQDPGNLGTIIRTAAWFGIKDIFCSPDCADVYNSKVVQATMGAILHTSVMYGDLQDILKTARSSGIAVYGTMLGGTSLYEHKLSRDGVILLGNESKGVSDKLNPFITERITIPKMNSFSDGIDSLNVGMAAAIICSEFVRRVWKG